ncbi:acetylglutamate kinase [Lachnoanaerobaculum sp. Marseille-Q4761]|jgi:acetylglutamate kinase|uniref:acetylglutamate kinase n=1 Tax=Lachnoanaerobaculum sp. Marseille-Q4761 TaxID=2819511 RepID=UPI001AA0EE58|nr:acetylglutamate kinase [Lachnoanaerobaculum sp. Marseille-Q4761]MBO1869730.1 acetylglutamate kinase [Lachnoanaerobaculum sp. Marseille-Q4761]
MDKLLEKAQILIEALPYIQAFNKKIVVVKYGGSAMLENDLKKKVIQDIVLLKLVGLQPVIVHGGGKEISKWLQKVNIEAHFVNGFRFTDNATMEVVEMVLNKVNKELVQMIGELGMKAVGISGKDGSLLHCHKKDVDGEDIGFVGEVIEVKPDIIFDLLEKDFVPVICPVGFDRDYTSYNVNADDAACAVAKALKADKLAFLTDVEGVYKDFNDKESLIEKISVSEITELIEAGQMGGGMLPKLTSCVDAVKNGVSKVTIVDGRIPHCLLLELFTNKGIGTMIVGD